MNPAYQVVLHPRTERELDKVPGNIFSKIDTAIRGLRENPRPFGVKKLEGDLHRVRVGERRIIYAIMDRERWAVILHVTPRSERTYKSLR